MFVCLCCRVRPKALIEYLKRATVIITSFLIVVHQKFHSNIDLPLSILHKLPYYIPSHQFPLIPSVCCFFPSFGNPLEKPSFVQTKSHLQNCLLLSLSSIHLLNLPQKKLNIFCCNHNWTRKWFYQKICLEVNCPPVDYGCMKMSFDAVTKGRTNKHIIYQNGSCHY